MQVKVLLVPTSVREKKLCS
uniref:Uncharacterized protein n=1 Tax=Zea mays TaxID=4577 RepID=C0PBL8_MAIZE|nr:unknown [Zea mays]